MEIMKVGSYEEMSKKAAEILKEKIKDKKNSVIGLPTGSTPLGFYKELIEMNKNGEIDLSEITTFNLDEYVGLSYENEKSYHYYMMKNFFEHVNVKKEKINIPNGNTEDIEKECEEYEKKIKGSGGIDIQFLGIGTNGHIGFNEPNEYFENETHKVKLDEKTRKDNARFFKTYEEVPKYAITMGIKTIFSAKEIVLLVSGKNKTEALKNTVEGKITPKFPSSILQLHNKVTVISTE